MREALLSASVALRLNGHEDLANLFAALAARLSPYLAQYIWAVGNRSWP